MDAQAGFVEAVERFISGAFSPAKSESTASPYKVEVLVDEFAASFSDRNEGARLLIGLFAGTPKLESRADIIFRVSIRRDERLLISERIHAEGVERSDFWTCGDINTSVQRAVEAMVKNSFEKIERRVFAQLVSNNAKLPIQRAIPRTTSATKSPTKQTSEKRLEELKKLLDDGLITPDEAAKKRQEILNSL